MALLLGLFYMLWKKIIDLAHSGIYSGDGIRVLWYHVSGQSGTYVSPVVQLLSGGLMLGAVFMATDYVTSPMSTKVC
mgnify:CR=1 FL=1